MEHRKGFKNYLINGCREIGTPLLATMSDYKVQLGFRLGLVALGVVTLNWALALIGLFAPIFPQVSQSLGLKIQIKKDGLTGDNLKLVEDLEKRFSELPDAFGKEQMQEELSKLEQRIKGVTDLDVAKLKEMLGEDGKGVRSILLKQGEEITKLKQQLSAKVDEPLSVRAQVAKWNETNKDAIAKIKSGQKADLTTLEIRAADSPMTPTTVFGGGSGSVSLGAAALILNGAPVIDLLRVQPTLWDLLPKGRTNLETFPWVNKKVPANSGAADFLAPGSAKPKVSFTLEAEKSNAKKPAVSMKVATELLDDIDGMTSYIEAELIYQLKTHINSILMGNAAASATDPAGIRSFAVAYTLTGIETQNPNNWDCARAVIAQMRAAFIDGPILILMNPVDTANMDMAKAVSAGQYLGLNLRPIPGGYIVEDYNVTAGNIMAIALDALKTLMYKDVRIAYGWENDDFTKNLVTAICEARFHQFHSDNHANAFVYEQLADIKSAIAIP